MTVPYDSIQLDNVLEALANSKRRGMVHDLSLHPATIGQLSTRHKLSLQAMHKHMRILEKADLITRKKSGRTNFVALNPKSLNLAQKWIMQYKTNWGSTAASLDNYIARMKE